MKWCCKVPIIVSPADVRAVCEANASLLPSGVAYVSSLLFTLPKVETYTASCSLDSYSIQTILGGVSHPTELEARCPRLTFSTQVSFITIWPAL